MSGIAGIFYKDGAEVMRDDLAGMANGLRHRGPDGTRLWCQGSVGMVNCALHTTPESLLERMPSSNPAQTAVITADARIDNRAELLESLNLNEPHSTISDGDLILRAYETWGENCASKLIGDFAFTIWDCRRRFLFCARDAMGVKALYYYDSPRLFAFASEIKALLCLKDVPRQLNEVRVADYLVNLFEDREITFYKGIQRIPAATSLSITSGRTSRTRYWSLDAQREIRLGSDEEYAEAFRDLFTGCVRSRLRSAFPIASTLSGGLDSSAIACLSEKLLRAKGQTLHTVSAVFPGAPETDLPAIDERRYIQAALATGNFNPHYIRADLMSPMRQNDRMHFHLDEANFAPNLYMHWAMFEEVSRHGVRVLLDGFDGDTTVSHGFARLHELLFSFQWKTLASEVRMLRDNLLPEARVRNVFMNLCIKPIAPVWAFRMKRILKGRFQDARGGNRTLIGQSFAQEVGVHERVKKLTGSRQIRPRTSRESHLEGISDGLYAIALENADKSAAAFGVEVRYPFFDRRLMEFCLALPADQKYARGWNRVIFRRSMDGILPSEIQWRPNKGNLGSNFYRKLLELENRTMEEILDSGDPAAFSHFVDKTAMQSAYQRFRSEPFKEAGSGLQVFAATNLALWLRQTSLSV
jgi:asparagine synthase (glutamine-hydrolysing)